MRLSLVVIAALLLGALGAQFLSDDRGYVLLSFAGYIIEMSVPFLIVALILGYLAIRFLGRMLRAPKTLKQVAGRSRARRAHERLTRGLIAISEGRWARGERILTRQLGRSESPLLNYLAAARAAQLQGAHERRDNWLKLAHEGTPRGTAAVLLTQAELQLEDEEYEEALATLRRLDEHAPNQPQGLALTARIYRNLGDWQALKALLPRLRTKNALAAEQIEELSRQAHIELLHEAGNAGPGELRQTWQATPRNLQQQPELVYAFARGAMACGATELAEPLLRRALKSSWDEGLVLLYGELDSPSPEKQLKHAETWLKTRGDDAALLLAVARLCMRAELWGKARSYLESSLALRPRADAYQLYGRLLEKLGEEDDASKAFRSGLALVTGRSGELPALTGPDE